MSQILITAHLLSILVVGVFLALLLQSHCASASFADDMYEEDERRVIKIGVVFRDEGTADAGAHLDAEIAFRAALERFNFVREYEMRAIVRHVAEADSFKTGQIVCEMLTEGISAIFGPQSAMSNDIVQSIAETLEIPQFQTFWNPKLAHADIFLDRTVFNLYPEPKLFAKALSTLVREMRWKSYAIIYENDDGLTRLQEVLKSRKADDPAIIVKKITPGGDHRPLLKEIKDTSELQIILDCETDHILDILQQAQEVNLVDEYHSYILTSLDAHTLNFNAFKHLRSNITMMRLIEPNRKDVRNAVHDWLHTAGSLEPHYAARIAKIGTENIRMEAALLYDAINFFGSIYKELDQAQRIVTPALSCDGDEKFKDGMRLTEFFKVRDFNKGALPGPLSGQIRFDKLGRRTDFELQIVELTVEGIRKTGSWNSKRPNIIESSFTQQERQMEIVQQLSQKVFRVTSRLGAPYLMYKEPKPGERLKGNDRFEGYSMDLISGISEILNFTFKFELVPDNNYGSYDEKTKEWNGLIRALLDRKADLAVCDLTITYERRTAVDFTMPFMTLGISILFSKQVKAPPDLFSFMHPLSLDIWLYMATAYLLISLIIYLVARFAPGDWENPHPCNEQPEELENIWNMKNCLWLTLGSLMAQGCDILPKGISTRMIAGMWWFFSLIMCASYTANLAAFLTMERMGPTIESAEDLAKQTTIKYGCVSGGATCSFFRDSNFSTYHRMWTQMQSAEPSVYENSNKEGVKRVKTSKRLYAFLMENTGIEYEMERDCELRQVGGWLDSKGYGIAMPVNSPYRTAISGAVLKMQEDGKLHKLKQKWWKQMHGGGKCSALKHAGDETAAELGIDNVGGIFVVLVGGIATAFLLAIAEFFWNVRKVAVTHHIGVREALEQELRFAMHFSVSKKRVNPVVNPITSSGSALHPVTDAGDNETHR